MNTQLEFLDRRGHYLSPRSARQQLRMSLRPRYFLATPEDSSHRLRQQVRTPGRRHFSPYCGLKAQEADGRDTHASAPHARHSTPALATAVPPRRGCAHLLHEMRPSYRRSRRNPPAFTHCRPLSSAQMSAGEGKLTFCLPFLSKIFPVLSTRIRVGMPDTPKACDRVAFLLRSATPQCTCAAPTTCTSASPQERLEPRKGNDRPHTTDHPRKRRVVLDLASRADTSSTCNCCNTLSRDCTSASARRNLPEPLNWQPTAGPHDSLPCKNEHRSTRTTVSSAAPHCQRSKVAAVAHATRASYHPQLSGTESKNRASLFLHPNAVDTPQSWTLILRQAERAAPYHSA